MSKAIAGAAMLGVDAALIGGAIFSFGATAAADALVHTALGAAITAIGSTGVAMEAGAIANALAQNRGMGITIRQPAANRNYVYGMQRVGGTAIFESTTGSGPAQRNYVIVLADHECYAINGLFIDGRQVFFKGSGPGWSVRNGVGFGGNADGNDHTDEGGNHYNFGGLVYCEARYGDQLPGDVISGLTANDPRWAASSSGSPYVGGCCYLYLKIEADQNMFPSDPEIRVTLQGKCDIWDPRTNTKGYTNNWALCVADALQNSEFGVGESQANINTDQLIAAANVCDQQIESVGAGTTESAYTINGGWDTATSPGDLLVSMMASAQGRLGYIGGEWFVFPAYWQGPSFTFNEGDLLNPSLTFKGKPIRERYNRVRGSFTAPRFPYSVKNGLSDLYDSNGFYDGTRANLFGLEWMAESYPDYAQDALHGYASDKWLAADNGIERVMGLDFKATISIATAQRLAKIALLRNRLGGGTTTLTLSLAAYQVIPCDVIQLNYAPLNWVNKLFEVTTVNLRMDYPDDGPPNMVVDLSVQETDPSIYEWDPSTEELTINDTPPIASGTTIAQRYLVSAPSNVTTTDGSFLTPDGVLHPQLSVSWSAATDAYATQYEVQYQKQGATTWLAGGTVAVPTTSALVGPTNPGTTYNVRVRSVRPNGQTSAWVSLGTAYTPPLAYSQINSSGLAPTPPA